MYSNAGIRSHHTLPDTNINTLPNNRHIPTTSDPPRATNNPFSSLSPLSIFGGHAARRSEDGILSASAAPLRSASVQTNMSTGRTTTTVLAPPSSFHVHSKTSTSVSRNPSHVASSSSISSYNINHNKAPPGLSTSLFLSRTALSKPVAHSTPSVSRSSSISRRNGSNCSGTAPVEPVAPQRINMKRLMSKPTAILVPDRAQSAMAFAAQPHPSDTDDSRSIEDHLAIKSRSLDILRRSRRRSRSVDLLMNYGVPSSYPVRSHEGPLHRTTTSIGLPSTSAAARFLAGEEYARDLRSPTTPKTSRPASILLPDYNGAGPHSFNSEDENVDSPGFPLSPASVIALTWTQSQKRANSSSAIASLGESSSSSAIPQSGFTALDCLDSASVSSPVVFADANEVSYQIDLSSPPIVTNSPVEICEDVQEEYFTPWAVAEQGQSPGSQLVTRDASCPPTKGGHDGSKVGIAATMREVSRRFTGAFGRREKKQVKPAVACFPINHPPSSLSMVSFPPNLESNSSPPSPFSSNPVSKAPKSHERTGSLTLSHITGPVKNEPPSNNQLLQALNPPVVVRCQPADTKAFTAEFDQLYHTPLSIHISASPQASISERDSLVEVTTPRQPTLEMPNWSLLHSSSSQRTTVDGNGQELTLSRQTSNQISPLSPINLDRGRIPNPARSNTLKKRSRPSLRAKPSSSALVPVSGIATEGTETIGVHSTHVLSSTPPSLSLNEGTVMGGKLRVLVRKLSSGTLARSSSQSDRSRSPHTRASSPEIHGAGADDVPPVPQIPKDFELIMDADAYFAERARLRREGKIDSDGESIPSGQGHGGLNTTLRIPGSSQMSSRHSSLLGHKEQVPADLSSLSSSLKSRLRVAAELDRAASSSKQPPVSVPVRRKQPPSVHDPYTFPKRANTMMEHGSSQVDYIGSSSPSQSYLHAVNMLYSTAAAEITSGSVEENTSLSSHSHEMVSSYPNSILAQPIMPPKDLYQHGEDEAAMLRRQQSKDTSTNHFVRRKRSGGTLPAGRSVIGSQEQSPAKPPPRTLSPSLLPLTAPPPRPPRRVKRVQSSNVLDSMQRPTYHHQRSLSSPTSPTIPTFLTTKITNSPAPSNRSRSVGNSPRSPQASTSTGALPSAQGKRARSDSVGKKAKHLPHLVVRPRGSESASNVSPNPASGERSAGKGGSQPKVRVKTSLGTITRAKSVVTPKSASSPKSASHTPSSSASYTHSPQSSGHRSSLSRTSRDHSFGHGWVTVDDGEAPPVPFTSTAFTFKEISPVTGPSPAKGKALTEGEREDLWNALLSRSDRVGGTLTITMDQTEGPALLSDNASFKED